MKRDELAARLRKGPVTLAFDTNAVYSDRRLFDLCDLVDQFNVRQEAAGRARVRLLLSAVAYAEKLFDLKQKFRDKFDMKTILEGLRRKNIEFQPFDDRHALETAVHLGQQYETDEKWQQAKRARYLSALGLSRNTAIEATGSSCGATVDWLIGGHALAEGCILVTNDTGIEFKGLERVRLDVLEAAVAELLGESP